MSRTDWQRLRGRHRSRDIRQGLQARMADPLWLLARQWQFGAFKGDDAASPAKVHLEFKSLPVDQLQGRNPDGSAGRMNDLPQDIFLETAVEREAVANGPAALRLSAEAGLQFLRRWPKAKRETVLPELQRLFRLKSPNTWPPGQETLLTLLLEASFDAREFAKATDKTLTDLAAKANVDSTVMKEAFATWSAYYHTRFAEPVEKQDFWQKERLEYCFAVVARQDETVKVALEAEQYPGGRLDWYHFDLNAAQSKGLAKQLDKSDELWLIPTPVRYAGMPAERFWDFEDGNVYFGGLSAGATDLAQLLVTEFAMVYSNDWYMLPVPVETGTLTRITSLDLFDSFGERHRIQPAAVKDGPDRVWRFFELNNDPSAENGLSPWLYVPRAVLGGQEDRPVEQVIFTRDEMANLAWGIEQIIEGTAGHRVSRRKQWLTHRAEVEAYLGNLDSAGQDQANKEDPAWVYRLLSVVPPYWVPFAPEVQNDRVTNRLLRSRMGEWDLLGELKPLLAGAHGRILAPEAPMALQEEEIPRGAIEVTRSYQAARDSSGRLVVWVGRRKRPASGNRSSGRETDKVERGGGAS